MRRDVYIENDSGGFSVLAADAVDAIIEDARSDDFKFVAGYKALLLELYGDDSMIVRIVVDEGLTEEEQAQWLARASWRIDTKDGRMLAMGGFDPDVLGWWKDGGGLEGNDGRGVAFFQALPGSWRVDVYAHVGSMNGRAILSESGELPGAAFRRSHPGRAFPPWLANMLDYSGEEDPGYEELWRDVKASVAAGKLAIDAEAPDAVGLLLHVTRGVDGMGDPPEEIWFGRADNSRVPDVFPVGLDAEVVDRNIEYFRDKLLDRKRPEPERPIAGGFLPLIESWPGDTLKPVDGGSVPLAINDIYLLHWMHALTADSPPRFELWVQPRGAWTPPASTPDFAVTTKSGGVIAIGPVTNTGGWHTWWASRLVAQALTTIPDGSTVDFASLRTADDAYDEAPAPEVGRGLYSGNVVAGKWEIAEASPKVSRQTLSDALAFVTEMARNGRIRVRPGGERRGFDSQAEMFSAEPGSLIWEGDTVRVADGDERTLILVATPVFRTRFGSQWPVDTEPDDDDD